MGYSSVGVVGLALVENIHQVTSRVRQLLPKRLSSDFLSQPIYLQSRLKFCHLFQASRNVNLVRCVVKRPVVCTQKREKSVCVSYVFFSKQTMLSQRLFALGLSGHILLSMCPSHQARPWNQNSRQNSHSSLKKNNSHNQKKKQKTHETVFVFVRFGNRKTEKYQKMC